MANYCFSHISQKAKNSYWLISFNQSKQGNERWRTLSCDDIVEINFEKYLFLNLSFFLYNFIYFKFKLFFSPFLFFLDLNFFPHDFNYFSLAENRQNEIKLN
jgi:hypothetical protein